jgi:hypothetical protein
MQGIVWLCHLLVLVIVTGTTTGNDVLNVYSASARQICWGDVEDRSNYQSQSLCRHAKTVLESFFVLCIYRPHDNGIGVASDKIRKSLLCTVSASSWKDIAPGLPHQVSHKVKLTSDREVLYSSVFAIVRPPFWIRLNYMSGQSGMSYTMSRVRSTMNNDRLSLLALMHIHRDFSVDLDKVMEKFVSAKTRRTDFGQF